MNFDGVEFSKILKANCECLIDRLRKLNDRETICSFALYSDGDGCTILTAYNTLSHQNDCIAGDPDDEEEYIWSTSEWSGEGDFDDELANSWGYLKECRQSMPEHKVQFFECVVSTLEELRPKISDCLGEGVIVLFTLTDYDSYPDLGNWCSRLNSKEISNRYRSWLPQ